MLTDAPVQRVVDVVQHDRIRGALNTFLQHSHAFNGAISLDRVKFLFQEASVGVDRVIMFHAGNGITSEQLADVIQGVSAHTVVVRIYCISKCSFLIGHVGSDLIDHAPRKDYSRCLVIGFLELALCI